jgi:hypothetical protein
MTSASNRFEKGVKDMPLSKKLLNEPDSLLVQLEETENWGKSKK